MPEPIRPATPEKVLNTIERGMLGSEVVEAIKTVYDPEIPVNVYDLGLIYDVIVNDDASVHILMTLTSPACPVAEALPEQVREAASEVLGVRRATIELTWDPPFTIDRIPDEIKLMLGLL